MRLTDKLLKAKVFNAKKVWGPLKIPQLSKVKLPDKILPGKLGRYDDYIRKPLEKKADEWVDQQNKRIEGWVDDKVLKLPRQARSIIQQVPQELRKIRDRLPPEAQEIMDKVEDSEIVRELEKLGDKLPQDVRDYMEQTGATSDTNKTTNVVERPKGKFVPGDKVKIVGESPVYGGLGGDAGVPVPKWVQEKVLDVVQSDGEETLVNPIYSWVPNQHLKLHIPSAGNPNQTGSDISSTPVTPATTETNPTVSFDKVNAHFLVDPIDCYVKNLVTGTVTPFLISPETISDNMVANFEDQAPKARSSPFKAYSGSGPRDVSFTLPLYEDYCQPLGIMKTIKQLQALTLPEKTGGYVQPPRCYVKVGAMIEFTAVCLSVSTEWAKPYRESLYLKADVTLSFNQIEETSSSASGWEA